MIKTIDFREIKAPADFVTSLAETGFAVITNHGIDPELLETVYKDWASFFGTKKSKFNYLRKEGSQSGYFPFRSENAKDVEAKDLKEFYHVYSAKDLPEHVDSETLYLMEDLSEIAKKLLSWVQESSPKEVQERLLSPLPDMIENSQQTLLRVLHYPPLNGDHEEGAVRAAAHSDINLLTVLPAATFPGLMVLQADGSWHMVDCDPGSLIVNVGDMLQLVSGDYFKSTVHRVVNPTGLGAKHSRYSMPLFLHPRPEVQLTKELTAGQALAKRLEELGL